MRFSPTPWFVATLAFLVLGFTRGLHSSFGVFFVALLDHFNWSRGATAGVRIKNAESREVREKVDTIVVDKTGTLTEGKPRLTAVETLPGWNGMDVLRLAASLERGSEHPLAVAILAGAKARGLSLAEVSGFASVPGHGVKRRVQRRDLALGNAQLLHTTGVGALPPRARGCVHLRA